jgi:hypothetical protein
MFDDTSLSRIQCTIKYAYNRWVIVDGTGKRGSTNGTWLFLDNFVDIYDGMLIKMG